MGKLDIETFGKVTRLLTDIQQLPSGSPIKTREIKAVVEILRKNSFIEFPANNGAHFFPGQVGQWVKGCVSSKKTGHLRPFRGMTALVVCVGSGLNRTRKYMAGAVQ